MPTFRGSIKDDGAAKSQIYPIFVILAERSEIQRFLFGTQFGLLGFQDNPVISKTLASPSIWVSSGHRISGNCLNLNFSWDSITAGWFARMKSSAFPTLSLCCVAVPDYKQVPGS